LSVSNAAPSVVSTAETTPAISRTNVMLLVVLLLQLALSAYLFWPSSGLSTSGEVLLPGVTAASVTALTITDDSDRSVKFVKEGDVWTLADSDGYPANSEKITQTLDKLVAIATDRLVTQTSSSHGRLQVADNDYLRKVDITTSSGVQTLYLGSSAGASSTHVRAATEEATYLTNQVATWELDTLQTTWIDVSYYEVPKEQITEVTLENANGTLTFVPNGEEWTLSDATPDEPVASANINTLIDRIVSLNLHTVLGKSDSPDYGLDAPLATLTVTSSETTTGTTTAETKTTTLLVGAKDDETNTYYLKSSDSEFYVRLAAFTGDEFVNKQRSDFMVQPEAATDAAGTPLPEAPVPAVAATDVPTGTSELESATTPTATVGATGVQTSTSELESETTPTATIESTAEATVEATVESSDVPTDTNELDETNDEAASTATPTN
jgi:hypothetical protein